MEVEPTTEEKPLVASATEDDPMGEQPTHHEDVEMRETE